VHRVVNRFYSPLKPAAGRHGHRFSFLTFNNGHDRVLTQWTAIEYIGDDDEVGLEAFFCVYLWRIVRELGSATYVAGFCLCFNFILVDIISCDVFLPFFFFS